MYFISRPAIHVLAVIIFILLTYSNTFNGPFVFDDNPNIVSNPTVKNLHYYFDTSGLENVSEPLKFHKALFMPRYIGSLSFALNHAVHGLDVRGYHLVNTAIHIFASLLVYVLVFLTFKTPCFLKNIHGDTLSAASRNVIALFSALMFAVHPVQTQAVTYIVQRFASLTTLFWLLSLVGYAQFRLTSGLTSSILKRYILYTVSLVSAILAMRTKEMALLLPVVIVLYEFMFFDGRWKQRILRLIPLCMTMAIIPLSLFVTSGRGLVKSSEAISSALGGISRSEYLVTQFRVLVTYVRLLLFPINQTLDYDYPVYQSFFTPEVFISFLFLLSVFVVGVFLFYFSCDHARKNRHLYRLAAFGIFWFFITISVESSIIPIDDVIFEHRLYLPSIGFFLLLTSSIELLRLRWNEHASSMVMVPIYGMLILTVVFSAAAYARNSLWGDGAGLLEDNVRHAPDKARTHNTLGSFYAATEKMDAANRSISKAIEIDHKNAEIHNMKGNSHVAGGRFEEAVIEYKRAIILRPYYADYRCNLGDVYIRQGRLDEAEWVFTTAIRVDPKSDKAHFYLGNIYNKLKRREDAVIEYQAALKIMPDLVEAHYNLGNTYAGLGRNDEAKKSYLEALRIMPDFIEARRKLDALLSHR